VVVVGEAFEDVARRQLAVYRAVEVVVERTSPVSGLALLLGLARVLARDPGARVLVFPAEHQFARPSRLVVAAENALAAAALAPSGLALIGVAAEHPAFNMLWVMRGRRLGPASLGARSVTRLVEATNEGSAIALLAGGGLWSTSIIGGSAEALWRLSTSHLPRQAATLQLLRAAGGRVPRTKHVRRRVLRLDPADFTRDVLRRAAGLGVVCMLDSGWSPRDKPALSRSGRATKARSAVAPLGALGGFVGRAKSAGRTRHS
jgi:mannose-1-phosphate guanylyltransferase